ncbi:MAG: Hpt domain-containing protein [Pseudolabrys sp.]
MVQGAVSFVDRNGPAHGYAVLDRAHLTRMTFNDPSLEQEVLQLFERQAELLMVRIRKSAPAAIATLAHTLKGSAVGIGADRAGGRSRRTSRKQCANRVRWCDQSARAGSRRGKGRDRSDATSRVTGDGVSARMTI